MTDDPWIAVNSPIAAEKLHALGVIAFRWNSAQVGLKIIHTMTTGQSVAKGWPITESKRDKERCKDIEKFFTESQNDESVKSAIIHAVRLYDVNRLNRNQLTHFIPHNLRDSDLSRVEGEFEFFPFPDSTDDIRRVAGEIEALTAYLSGLLNFFAARQQMGHRALFDAPPPLPDKPHLPDKIWKPRPTPRPPTRSALRPKSSLE